MSAPVILYSSADIHAAVKKLFSEPNATDRRVAIVAYVGADGASYLPHPKSLRIICSPSAGGTDPDTLRALLKRDAVVQFSDGLHMKVYWSQERGCIIASANASSSALGVNGLKEAGVLFAAGEVDIERLIQYAKPRPVTRAELRKLDTLAKDRQRKLGHKRRERQPAADFLDWYSLPHRQLWKLNWAEEEVQGNASAVKEQTLSMYGLREPHTWASVAEGRVKRTDWLLCFLFTARGVSQVEWKYVDFVVKLKPKDKHYSRKWSSHAVQVHAAAKYPLPPFRITPLFRAAFRRAVKWYDQDNIENSRTDAMPTRLLNRIAQELKVSIKTESTSRTLF